MIETRTNLNNTNENIERYFYTVNYPSFEEELCKMEIKYLFSKSINCKHFFSHQYITPSRSPFLKQCLSIIFSGNSLDEIINKIVINNLAFEKFKVCYIKLDDEKMDYKEQLKVLKLIGLAVTGEADMRNPKTVLGITKVEGKWIFGQYEKNNFLWHHHNKKPYSYSNGLGLRMSKAIVNIAVANDLECSIIDPCCGVGTVVIEALSLAFNIKGYEINAAIGENAKRNLKFLGYEDVVTIGDMHSINDYFDVSIIDLPYGLFTPTTLKEQIAIMNTARKISKRMVIVTFEDMDKHKISSGFKILDRCTCFLKVVL
jgi:tRNA G10  N-methylase Trm11